MRGILPLARQGREEGIAAADRPQCGNAGEAAVVEGVETIGAASLAEVVEYLRGEQIIAPTAPAAAFAEEGARYAEDFADVKGQRAVKRRSRSPPRAGTTC